MVEIARFCPDCRGDQLFEQYHPAAGDCPDSPDGRCSEWSCTECGAAMLIGFAFWPAEAAPAREPGRRVA
jgi:hypothetical protein